MKKLKLYIETSAWNFVFAEDAPEKMQATKEFFDLVRQDVFEVYSSFVVLDEVERAPEPRREQVIELINTIAPIELDISTEAEELTRRYLERGIVPEKKQDDALHVALATIAELDAVVTWNYRHLANLKKSELFHGINLEMGYFKKVEIVTPPEVLNDED